MKEGCHDDTNKEFAEGRQGVGQHQAVRPSAHRRVTGRQACCAGGVEACHRSQPERQEKISVSVFRLYIRRSVPNSAITDGEKKYTKARQASSGEHPFVATMRD